MIANPRKRRRYGKPTPRKTAAEAREQKARQAQEDHDVKHVRRIVSVLTRGQKRPSDDVGFVRLSWTFKRPRDEASELEQAKLVREVMGRGADGYDLDWNSKLEPSFAFFWHAATDAQRANLLASARALEGVKVTQDGRQNRPRGFARSPDKGPDRTLVAHLR